MLDLPSVTLDTTLADLYGNGLEQIAVERVALVLCAANSELGSSSHLSRNRKYLYQDSTFSNAKKNASAEETREAQRHMAIKYLSLVPQHDAFAAGDMKVILFNLDKEVEEENAHSKKEAIRTMDNLNSNQRPDLVFLPGPSDISLKKLKIDRLAVKMELDELVAFPTTVSLDTHYFLNSKGGLATSGLPTPRCDVLELESIAPNSDSCCETCRATPNSRSIPAGCSGSRAPWLASQISRITNRISRQPIPFICKNQQTFGGGGTFQVSTEEDRKQLIEKLSSQILPKLLSQVTPENAHLHPATILLSELVDSPIADIGLTFFITKAGETIFLAVTEQTVDDDKAWIGSKISYPAQRGFKDKYSPIMHDIGTWLHRYGYYGPCGADILETSPAAGENGPSLHIVDLNVRTSGSLVLGLLGGHFSERRGLHEASSFSVTVKMTRESFIDKLARQFQEGRVVIVSWYEDIKSGVSLANLVIGGKDRDDLEENIKIVKQNASEIHF